MTIEVPETQTQIFRRLLWCIGEVGMTILCAIAITIVVGIILNCRSKPKQSFGLWLISVSVKFSVLSALFLFFVGLVKTGTIVGYIGVKPWDRHLDLLYMACIAPMFLLGLAWFAFIAKFILEIKMKLANQRVDPTVKTPVESGND